MIRGLYSAATGLEASSLNQDVVAENLAHFSVPGYRRQGVAYQTFETTLAEVPTPLAEGQLLGNLPSTAYTDFQPGPLQPTGNPLDLAALGDTYFVLDSPAGPVYTRNGSFRLNGAGELVNASGLRVRGEGGAILIPQGTSQITVTGDGFVLADGNQVARLQLETIANPRALQRVGPALFTGPPPLNPPEPGTVVVEQGYREGSNVQPVQEMVTMIRGVRFYEAAQRALRTLSEALSLQTRPAQG